MSGEEEEGETSSRSILNQYSHRIPRSICIQNLGMIEACEDGFSSRPENEALLLL